MAYTDENGKAQGTIIDLTNELAAMNGYRVKWVNYPINRIYRTLNTGDIDFWPGSPNVPALEGFTVEASRSVSASNSAPLRSIARLRFILWPTCRTVRSSPYAATPTVSSSEPCSRATLEPPSSRPTTRQPCN
ncbi:transporter substrate-binding domain-containing protein [Halopseudomonas pachastrellae]|nr:transporter substrate-binding domain-containing protein [Halopseudomonas pachastrellae]